LTLERSEEGNFKFWLKKSKKKLTVLEVNYNPKDDKFITDNKEVTTHCLPHKIIHFESDTVHKLFALYEQRDKLDLRELIILIFKNFGLEGEALSLHHLRAFHLVDVLKQTSQEDIEKTLALSPEFIQSEKNAGIYLYTEKVKAVEDIPPEEAVKVPLGGEADLDREELSAEDLPEIGTVGEIEAFVELQEVEEAEEPVEVKPAVEVTAPPPPPKAPSIQEPPVERAEKAKKEKAPKKKRQRLKLETERAPRRRKGEKKFIEERIELEESEMEALIAVKADTKVKPKRAEVARPKKEVPAKEKKEEFEIAEPEKPMTGIFGDMLKSALEKKKPSEAEEEKEKKKTKAAAKKTTKKTVKKPGKPAEKQTEKKK
jgi:chemotaxis protein histidine kinase CheA